MKPVTAPMTMTGIRSVCPPNSPSSRASVNGIGIYMVYKGIQSVVYALSGRRKSRTYNPTTATTSVEHGE